MLVSCGDVSHCIAGRGFSRHMIRMAKRPYRIVGRGFSRDMIRTARKRLPIGRSFSFGANRATRQTLLQLFSCDAA